MAAILKQGNLTKQSDGYSLLWQERTCQLYATKMDFSIEKKFLFSIQITPETEVFEIPAGEANSSKFGFKVTVLLPKKRDLRLVASSEEERAAWIGSIKLAVNGAVAGDVVEFAEECHRYGSGRGQTAEGGLQERVREKLLRVILTIIVVLVNAVVVIVR